MKSELTRAEAAERAELLRVSGYDVALDLTQGPERFGSVSRIRFECDRPGASTWVDVTAAEVSSVVLNGTALDPSSVAGRRLSLTDLQAENELVVVGSFEYSRTGEGLHRFVDPADGDVYLWSETVLFNANRIFACFDQPDLKAPLRLSVQAPDDWIVLSNGAGTQLARGRWEFDETPPLSTYFMVVVAGPYASAYSSHDGVDLGVHCRRSLADHLDADELFEITRQSFDYYHRIFGIRYPFGRKYDQAFVPEFNAGAMENPGCVTFTDKYIFRSRVTDSSRQGRAETIAHELAHMWFGDLVTMRWWDDLWLNESFAEYMGTLTLAEATRFRSAWTTFCASTKAWGYRQDQLPSTHPIAADVTDTISAHLNFDGISYAKGAGVLKQLVAWVGFKPFLAGVRAYFDEHAWGNTSLDDLLRALERSSGRDLRAWSREWIETAGVNELRPEVEIDADGRYRAAAVLQSAPPEHPTLRSHRIAIGLYDIVRAPGREDLLREARPSGGDRLVRRDRLELDVVGERTPVPALDGVPVPDLLLLNDDDLTWAKIRLDARSLRAALDGWLCRIDESLPRALLWAATWDMVRDGELAAGDYLELVFESIAPEQEITLVQDILTRARIAIDTFGRPEVRDRRLAAFARRCLELLLEAEPAGDLQLAYARAYAGAAAEASDVDRICGWLAGRDVPDGLAIDAEFRWIIVRRLAALGVLDAADIDAERGRDQTSSGAEWAHTARASLPSAEAKESAWRTVFEAREASNETVRAVVRGFWQREQVELLASYVERYFEELPEVWASRTPIMAERITEQMFPAIAVSPHTVALTDAALATDPVPGMRRLLVEGRADLERALRARSVDVPG